MRGQGQMQGEYKNKFGPQSNNLSAIIRGFKGAATKIIRQKFFNINFAWQQRFHDRIIRNDNELNRIRKYVINNPEKWESDRNNPNNFLLRKIKITPPRRLKNS